MSELNQAENMTKKKVIDGCIACRLDEIIDVIQKIATGNFDTRAKITKKADIIDALATGVNMLVEELEVGMVDLQYVNQRTDEILEVIQEIAKGDYSMHCELTEKNDTFDALAIGVNMMIDDIKESIEKDKLRVLELEEAYSKLKAAQEASLNIMEDLDRQKVELNELNKKLQQEINIRKQAEEALKEKAKELERSNSELAQFAYIASHDLQEPLRMVSSYMQLLEKRYKDKLDDDAHEFIDYAVDGAMRMQQLINDLLAYSRVGTRGKSFEPIDSKNVYERAVDNLKVAIEESGAMILCDPLPRVMADASQLMQLLQNLIGNGIKFSGEGPPRINVSAEKKEEEWIFSVRDNGIGIDPEHQERIFQIFQRLHSRSEYPGTGIGLAVCKKIVERHGGRIWVESKPNRGSIFYFTIPEKGGGNQ
jgi:signal transduction histidine kinase/HAMP domain-containing protein